MCFFFQLLLLHILKKIDIFYMNYFQQRIKIKENSVNVKIMIKVYQVKPLCAKFSNLLAINSHWTN